MTDTIYGAPAVQVPGPVIYACPHCGKEYQRPKRLATHIARFHAETVTEPLYDPVEPSGSADDEVAPQEPETAKTWREKIWDGAGAARGPKVRKPAKARTPRGSRRQPASEMFGLGWSMIGSGLVRSGVDLPVGRVMQFQAPLAGEALDKAVAGTPLDRLVQPFARKHKDWADVSNLAALPLLVAVAERRPESRQALMPMLRAAVSHNLVAMAPILRRQAKLEEASAEAMADLGDLFGPGVDPVEAVIESIFAPVGSPDPE